MRELLTNIIWIFLIHTSINNSVAQKSAHLAPNIKNNAAESHSHIPNRAINQQYLPQIATTHSPLNLPTVIDHPGKRQIDEDFILKHADDAGTADALGHPEKRQIKGDFLTKQFENTSPLPSVDHPENRQIYGEFPLKKADEAGIADALGHPENRQIKGDFITKQFENTSPSPSSLPIANRRLKLPFGDDKNNTAASKKKGDEIENRRLIITKPTERSTKVDTYAIQIAGTHTSTTNEERKIIPWFSSVCKNGGPNNFMEYIQNIKNKALELLYAVFPKLDPNCQVTGNIGISDILKSIFSLTLPLLGVILPKILKIFGGKYPSLVKIILGFLNPIQWLLFPIKLILQLINLLFFGGKYCILGLCRKSLGNGPLGLILGILLKVLNPFRWLRIIVKWFKKFIRTPIKILFNLLLLPIKLLLKFLLIPFKLLFLPFKLLKLVLWPIWSIFKLLKDLPKIPFFLLRILFWPLRVILAPFRFIKFILLLPLRILTWPFRMIIKAVRIFFRILTWPIRVILSPLIWLLKVITFPIRLPFLVIKRIIDFLRLMLQTHGISKLFPWQEKGPFKLFKYFIHIFLLPSRIITGLLWPIRLILTPIKWLIKILQLSLKMLLKKFPKLLIKIILLIFKPFVKLFNKIMHVLSEIFKKIMSIFNPFKWIFKILGIIFHKLIQKITQNHIFGTIFSSFSLLEWIRNIMLVITGNIGNNNSTDLDCTDPHGCPPHNVIWLIEKLFACFIAAFKQFFYIGRSSGLGIFGYISDWFKGVFHPNPPMLPDCSTGQCPPNQSVGWVNPYNVLPNPSYQYMPEYKEPIVESPATNWNQAPAPAQPAPPTFTIFDIRKSMAPTKPPVKNAVKNFVKDNLAKHARY